ncbi:hypothetical protein CAEBREN_06891 [Caenorhabditis brenneri]|uniref:F-box domain-containing protein n=1 Tax=Caenorhabditis brenneri TaxID=135651 RepID=G0MR57_CAEBE|nr:hypothetical protein CAEBREN_06891 [Caenorhabditis brenneri]
MGDAEKKVVSIGGFDIPEHIIGIILEYCHLKEIVRLGKVSKGFRQAIGFLRPDLRITLFDLELDSLEIYCKMKSGPDIVEMQYMKHPRGCIVKSPGSRKEHFVDRNFILAFTMDNFGFLCFQTTPVEFFRLNFQFYSDDEKIQDVELLANEFLKQSIFSFQRRQTPFQVHNFNMNFTHEYQVCNFLRYLDQTVLQKLELHKRYLPLYEKVSSTELSSMLQWNYVDDLNLGDSVYDGPAIDFAHFDRAKVRLEEVTLQELIVLKDAFLASSTFEQFELELISFNENLFLDVFGPPLLFSDEIRGKWLFEYGAHKRFLSISLGSDGTIITYRRENWNEIAETFTTLTAMESILEDVEMCFRKELSKKSLFMMNVKESVKNRLHNIHVYINVENAGLSFELNTESEANQAYYYEDHEDGCMNVFGKERKLVEDQDFVTVLLMDLEFLLKHQTSTVSNLKIYLHTKISDDLKNRDDQQKFATNKFLTNFKKILESRDEPLQVKTFHMNPTSQEQVLTVLPYLEQGILETIHFESSIQHGSPGDSEKVYLEIGEIVKMKQWKEAKRLFVVGLIISTPVNNLLNFQTAVLTLQGITVDGLEILETALQSSSKFLIFDYVDFYATDQNDTNQNRPYDTFGRPSNVYKDNEHRVIKTWYFPIDGSGQDVVIEHRSDKKFTFYRASSNTRKILNKTEWSGLVLLANVVPEVMENILKKLDFRSILVLRKVCRDFRSFIDDTIIEYKPRKLAISVDFNSIETRFGYIGEPIHLYYKDDGNDCILVRENTEKENNHSKLSVKDLDYFSAFFTDLNTILGHPKSILNEFSIAFPFITDNQEIAERMLGRLKEYLQSRNRMISVKKVSIKAAQQSEFMHILPYINPKHLEIIELINQNEREDRLVVYEISKLFQWKMAKELVVKNFVFSLPVEKLTHFLKIECCVDTITVADLVRLKDACLQFPKEFSLECKTFDTEDLHEIFGKPLREITPEGKRTRKWFYKIPNDSESVLQLVMDSSPSIKLTRIPISSVPQKGIIGD